VGRRGSDRALAGGLVGAGVITLDDLTVAYAGRPAIHHLSGRFAAGSLTAVVGPNGGGKSTLLKALAGLVQPAGGHIERAAPARDRLAFLPQLPELDRRFPISVLDAVLLGHWRTIGWHRAVDRVQRDQAAQALAAVGLGGFAPRPVATLSSGQLQRMLFARTMLQDAAVLLLDEPLTAVDTRTSHDLLALIDAWHGQGRTVIVVLHDLDLVRRRFPDTLLLARRCVDWGPTARVLTPANLAHAHAMPEAWDVEADRCETAASE
jgi:zinc/manganese transport system ATP-binding protein